MSYSRMKSNHNISDQDWELLAKSLYDQNPESAEGAQMVPVDGILAHEEKEQLERISKQVDLYFDLKKYPAGKAWEKVENRIQTSVSKKTVIRRLITSPIFRLAAAVVIGAALLVSGYEFFHNQSASRQILEVTATNQQVNTVTLPDGSRVSLNSDTRLRYPKRFGNKIREVSIEGEGFFEVKPNKNKPFIIHAGNAQIKVLGTSFNVNAYPETKKVEVIVETGKVQVINNIPEPIQTNELILTPGDKGTLDCSSNAMLKTTNLDPNFLAWKTHNLYFKATSLNEVIGNLEKVYKVNIRLADPRLNELLLTARFNDYSLDFILKVIETTFNIEVKNINGQYILKARS